MQDIDIRVLYYFNQFAGKSSFFDHLILELSRNNFFKGVLFSLLILFFWFAVKKNSLEIRQKIIAGLIGSAITLITARLLARLLPMRLRPKHNDALDFELPLGSKMTLLDGHSSFPSDHAALFFGLATLVFTLSRRLGLLAFTYVTIFIAAPRIYLGLHFLSDLLAGALLGTFVIILMNRPFIRPTISQPFLRLEKACPGIFYALFFFFLYQMTTLFQDLRAIGGLLSRYL